MASIFSKIIAGELLGRFVWKDDRCVAFLTIAPITPGHVLVVPRSEIDHWLDLPADDAAHLMTVAQTIGQAQMRAFSPARVGLMIAGMEVPHTHLHVLPIQSEDDLDFRKARSGVAEEMDAAAEAIRAALRAMSVGGVAD